MIKLKRNGCSCECYLELETMEVGQEVGPNSIIRKIKTLKNGKLRIEVDVYLESSCDYKDDEIRRDSYQTI